MVGSGSKGRGGGVGGHGGLEVRGNVLGRGWGLCKCGIGSSGRGSGLVGSNLVCEVWNRSRGRTRGDSRGGEAGKQHGER